MKNVNRLLGIVLLMLSACTTMAVGPDKADLCGPRPTDQVVMAAIQSTINSMNLKDPNSAQIRNVQIVDRWSLYKGLVNGGGYNYGWLVAFELNAKNGFGGYVGFESERILVTKDGEVFGPLQ